MMDDYVNRGVSRAEGEGSTHCFLSEALEGTVGDPHRHHSSLRRFLFTLNKSPGTESKQFRSFVPALPRPSPYVFFPLLL